MLILIAGHRKQLFVFGMAREYHRDAAIAEQCERVRFVELRATEFARKIAGEQRDLR